MLAFAVLFASSFFQPQDIVKDFKKFFKKERDPLMRIELVYSLEGEESVVLAETLLPLLEDKDVKVIEAARKVLSGFKDSRSRSPLLETIVEGKKLKRIAEILRLANDNIWKEYHHACLDYLVSSDQKCLLWAISLSGTLRNHQAIPLLVNIFEENKNGIIRTSVIDALHSLGVGYEKEVVPILLKGLSDSQTSVQVASCRALRTVRSKDAIEPLIDLLDKGKGRVMDEIWPTLVEITDNQFNDNPDVWRDWWAVLHDDYEIPTVAQISKRRSERAAANSEYRSAKTEATFMGVETSSRQIVFVIDVSGSMAEEIIDKDGFRERGFSEFTKLAVVREELTRSIEALGEDVFFNVFSFASNVYSWKKKSVKANALNKRSAIAWVKKLTPMGASNIKGENGRTNSYGGLMAGLGVEIDPKKRKVVTGGLLNDSPFVADTIFFLSDGKPTAGLYIDNRDIEQAIQEINKFRKVVIHTLAIGNFTSGLLQNLASQNGGVFVDLGR